MKKTSLFIIPFLGILFISCKKTLDNKPVPKPVPKVTSDSYLPITTGSNWKYLNIVNGVADTVRVKITEEFYGAKSKATASVTSTNGNNHEQTFFVYTDETKKETYYVVRAETYLYGTFGLGNPFEVPLGDNDLHTGEVKTTPLTDNGLFAMLNVRCVDTLIETGISKTVNGNTFDNVMHTRAYLQRNLPWNEWENMFVCDFYLAKGVGIIEIDVQGTYNKGLIGEETLIDYELK